MREPRLLCEGGKTVLSPPHTGIISEVACNSISALIGQTCVERILPATKCVGGCRAGLRPAPCLCKCADAEMHHISN